MNYSLAAVRASFVIGKFSEIDYTPGQLFRWLVWSHTIRANRTVSAFYNGFPDTDQPVYFQLPNEQSGSDEGSMMDV